MWKSLNPESNIQPETSCSIQDQVMNIRVAAQNLFRAKAIPDHNFTRPSLAMDNGLAV
ncbi:hypothetical protein K443DRAFT_428813 [Laccaria amethystina LaAM-08-1]|uniref:Uncharacterized protein n=1 Tax=Laccaria amethystina LaAM-08-1 TaxID=1095629 RepID=A0A0C9X4P9_9AGAR|nr:hypothetical protein K443DRAFT_428813 [Laccaria amethystina LaAM-08-1]